MICDQTLGVLWVVVLLGTSCLEAAAPSIQPLAILTNAIEVLRLSPEKLKAHPRVEVEGFVTCYEQRSSLFFVQDSSAGIYVYHPGADLGLRPSQRVRIIGVASSGKFTPIILSDRVVSLPSEGLPEPKRISPARLQGGADDSQWVEMEGVILSYRDVPGMMFLDMAHGPNNFVALLIKSPGSSPSLITNVPVRIRGVVGAMFDPQDQVKGFHVYVPGTSFVETIPGGGEGAAAMASTNANTRIRGQAVLVWPGEFMMVKDRQRTLRVDPLGSHKVDVGAEVEVEGPIRSVRFSDVVAPTTIRQLSSPSPIVEATPDWTRIVSGHFDGALVRLEGLVLSSFVHQTDFPWLMVQRSNRVFRVQIPKAQLGAQPIDIQPGATVRILGVIESDDSDDRGSGDLRLFAQSRSAIEVVRSPVRPMISAGWAAAGWLSAVLASAAAVHFVRTRGRREKIVESSPTNLSRELTAFIEQSPDAFLRVEATGHIRFANPAARDMLGIGEETKQQASLFRWVSPQHWDRLREVLQPGTGSGSVSRAELECVTHEGQTIQVLASFRQLAPEHSGHQSLVECVFRDVSESKRFESALHASEQQLRSALEHQGNLARDLHDNIIQSIYATGLGLESARLMLRQNHPDAEEMLGKGVGDLNRVLREIRAFLSKMSREVLDENDLETALKSLVVTMSRVQSIRFILDVDPLACGRLSSAQVNHLVHVAQEAMSNCVKHSGGKTAVVSLRAQEAGVRFEVRDDGQGFLVSATKLRGHGLRNIASRAQELAATFEVDSQPGKGTSIIFSIPTLLTK